MSHNTPEPKDQLTHQQGINLHKGLLRTFDEMSDEELLTSLRESGVDVAARAARIRSALHAGAERFFREKCEQRVVELRKRPAARARDFGQMAIEEARKLYEATLSRLQAEQKLTLCFRNRPSSELTDEDMLNDLAALELLGLLDLPPQKSQP